MAATEALPLTFYVDVDKGVELICEADPVPYHGAPCGETFPICSDDPGERWCVVENAINHVFTHIPGWEHTTL
jgi:hypothetical protein